MGGFALIHFLTYLFTSAWAWLKAFGSGEWPSADATVTADPTRLNRFGCDAVEIVYSYRFDGELYTGLQEEPVFGGSDAQYVEHFPKERSLVVRVKPDEPEVSVVRDEDQSDSIRKRLERIDELHDRKIARG